MKQDGIGLLGLIRAVMCGVEKHLQNTWALVQATKNLYTFWQAPTVQNKEYLKLFNARVTVLETLGGTIPVNEALILEKIKKQGFTSEDLENATKRIPDRDDVMAKAVKEAQKEYLALLALSGANATRFGGLRDKLENASLFGDNNYPKDQAELLHIMNKYKPEVARIQRNQQNNTEELAFVQAGSEKEKLAKAAKAGLKATPAGGGTKTNMAGESSCFHCGSEDHWQYDCPKLTPGERADLLKIKEDRDAKRREKGGKIIAQIGVVSLNPKRVGFTDQIMMVTKKCQDGVSLLLSGRAPDPQDPAPVLKVHNHPPYSIVPR